jgi:HSP20 family protein
MFWNSDLLSEMNRLRREMNGLFSHYGRPSEPTTFPLVNIYENNDAITVTAELPGLSKDYVNITYTDGVLTLAGKREPVAAVKDMSIVRRERSEGDFEKTIQIPTKIKEAEILASFSNGVLTISLPKADEVKPRTIAIEAK